MTTYERLLDLRSKLRSGELDAAKMREVLDELLEILLIAHGV